MTKLIILDRDGVINHDSDQFIKSVAKLSEQIGKNGHKIQRLRTKYKQYGEKWKANKLRPKDIQYGCF